MKTTLEIPDEIFRQSKAAAAMRGKSLKDFVTDALREYLESRKVAESTVSGWRRVYGKANSEEVAEIDEIIAQEFAKIEPDSWQ